MHVELNKTPNSKNNLKQSKAEGLTLSDSKRIKWGPYLTPSIKINLKWVKN